MIEIKKRCGGKDFREEKFSKKKKVMANKQDIKRNSRPSKTGKIQVQNKLGQYKTKTTAIKQEKTDWQKFKKDKKELKLKRKQAKDSYEICIEVKKLYEKLKCRKTEKKAELVEKLYNMISSGDTIKKMVVAHDTARIMQCMIKYARPSLREKLSNSLMPLTANMAISKYAHFCVLRMLKYGSPSTKSKVVESLKGRIVKLACHKISSKILDHIYLTVASDKQKTQMRQEFYGDLYKKCKDDGVKTLADTYKEACNMKASILGSVKSNLEHVANKKLVDNSLVHAVLLEYLQECEDDKLEEAVTMCANLIPLMLTTKEGCQAAILCFYKSSNKNRRAIIKAVKEHLVKICIHEHGHIFVIAVLNALDDTKATKKALYDTIHPHLQTLLTNQWGRRVIEWLVSPGDTNCFHPTFIATIEEGLKYGKKDKDARRKEIFEQIEEPLASVIIEYPTLWLSDKHIALVTKEILKRLNSLNFEKVAVALIKVIVNPLWNVTVASETKDKNVNKVQDVEHIIAKATKQRIKQRKLNQEEEEKIQEKTDSGKENNSQKEKDVETVLGIEEAGLHIALKKIIKHDTERSDNVTFGSLLVKALTVETLQKWLIINRACFILLNLVENNTEEIKKQLKAKIEPLHGVLKEQNFNGAKLLENKLF